MRSSVSFMYLPCNFIFSLNVVLTLPYLCKYLAYVVSRGIFERHQNCGFTFFFFFFLVTSAVLKQPITSVQNSSGSVTSNAIRWVGLFPLKKKYTKLEVCVCMYVSMLAHSTGGMRQVVRKGKFTCSMMFVV